MAFGWLSERSVKKLHNYESIFLSRVRSGIEKSSGTSQFVFEQNTLLENNDLKKNVVSVVKQERVR